MSRCKYCGAKLKRDACGLYCPTRGCQNTNGVDEDGNDAQPTRSTGDEDSRDARQAPARPAGSHRPLEPCG